MEFTASIVEIVASPDGVDVELDETAFFPEGGGQPGDRGEIAGVRVLDTRKDGERVLHRTDGTPEGGRVRCTVDRSHRTDYMQQHTGQHIISAALVQVADAPTVAVHQGDEFTTIEVDVDHLDDDVWLAVEEAANEVVRRNRPVTGRWIDDGELSSLTLRRETKRRGTIRIVEIDGVDRVACGGVHLAHTGEVGPIHWAGVERIRGRLRSFWRIGDRVRRYARLAADVDAQTRRLLSVGLADLPSRIEGCIAERDAALAQVREQTSLIAGLLVGSARAAADCVGDIRFVTLVTDRPDGAFARAAAEEAERSVAEGDHELFVAVNTAGTDSDSRTTWAVYTSPGVDLPWDTHRDAILSPIRGKGGGRPPFRQGAAGTPAPTQQEVAGFFGALRDALAETAGDG